MTDAQQKGSSPLRATLPGSDEDEALLAADPQEFARQVLRELNLPAGQIEATRGWSNRLWLSPSHVVRLSSGRFVHAYAHETAVLHLLPPTVPHAREIAHGQVGPREWLVLERVPGQALTAAWPDLTIAQRRAAISRLGEILRALHHTELPDGFSNPWLERAFAPGGPLRDSYHAPPELARRLIDVARQVAGVEPALLGDVETLMHERLGAFGDEPRALVHSDVHFANLLWDDGRITALLDFEGSRPAPPDLELDTLLRCCREPELFTVPGETTALSGPDLAAVPNWLAAAYPELFAHPRLPERLVVYDALWQLTQLLHFPPGSGPPDPWGHLRALVDRVDG